MISIKNAILFAGSILIASMSFSCKEGQHTNKNTEQRDTSQNEFKKEHLLKSKNFDTLINNKEVGLYWIESDSLKVAFTNYGGRIVGLWVPDKTGKMTDVVVGMNSVEGFIHSTEPYFGATIGRVGNRIAKGKFTIDEQSYTVPLNNGKNSLHGGFKGFQYVIWDAKQPDEKTLVLKYFSRDMEEGFPGNLEVTVTYTIEKNQTLKMNYEATTDKKTPVNLTNHAFFNLNGEGSGSILDHQVKFNANAFTPVDEGLIPTGELRKVENTPFDFSKFHTIGERINSENEQLKFGKGYDHNFVLNSEENTGLTAAAVVIGDLSGIKMEVFTQEPGIQFYSGNFMAGKNEFKSGAKDEYRTAFAIETQHFPDAPNQKNFPSILLNPGDQYHTISEYRFSVDSQN